MRCFLVVGAGEFQRPLIDAASKRYRVVVAAPEIPDDLKGQIDDYVLCDVRDRDAVLSFARKRDICGVITDQTDIAVRTVAYVAEQMNLPGIGYKTGELFTDKSKMKKRLAEAGIPMLRHCVTESLNDAIDFFKRLNNPVILKPLDTQGSRGVYSCKSESDIKAHFCESAAWSTSGFVIVEQYIENGFEFYVQGMAYNYEFRNLIIGDSEPFEIPNVFAARTRISPSTKDPALIKKTLDLNERIITSFGLKQGITESEFISDGTDVYLLETAARGGGTYTSSDQIPLRTGVQTEEFLIGIATGTLDCVPTPHETGIVCGYLAFYLPVGKISAIRGKEKVQSLAFVHRNQLDSIYVGLNIDKGPEDKTSRFAITVSGSSHNELEERMNYIRKTLQVDVIDETGNVNSIIW